jgi:hypothetical protein
VHDDVLGVDELETVADRPLALVSPEDDADVVPAELVRPRSLRDDDHDGITPRIGEQPDGPSDERETAEVAELLGRFRGPEEAGSTPPAARGDDAC